MGPDACTDMRPFYAYCAYVNLPLPSQLQLVLIYRSRRDERLSRPWCEVAPAEIQTCNLPIANPALYHTGTQPLAHVVVVVVLVVVYVVVTVAFKETCACATGPEDDRRRRCDLLALTV